MDRCFFSDRYCRLPDRVLETVDRLVKLDSTDSLLSDCSSKEQLLLFMQILLLTSIHYSHFIAISHHSKPFYLHNNMLYSSTTSRNHVKVIIMNYSSSNSRSETNGKLLMLLTRRMQHKQERNKDWPGKLAPACLNLHTRNRTNSLQSEKKRPVATSRTQVIKPIPLVKESSRNLCLRPVSMTNIKVFTNPSYTFSTLNHNISKALEVETLPTSLANTKANFQNSSFKHLKRKKEPSCFLSGTGKASEKERKKLSDYKIAYETFNYIDKVLQNPEKWGRFVEKKTKTSPKLIPEDEAAQERLQ